MKIKGLSKLKTSPKKKSNEKQKESSKTAYKKQVKPTHSFLSSVKQSVADVIPFKNYSDHEDCFCLKGNKRMDIFQFVCKDLVTINEKDRDYDYSAFTKFERMSDFDHKIICLNVPTDTEKQCDFIRKKIKESNNPYQKKQLNIKLAEEEWIGKNRNDKEYFLIVFAKDKEALTKIRSLVFSCFGPVQMIKKIDKRKKIDLVYRLYNKPSESGE